VSSLNQCDVIFSKSREGMYLYDNNLETKYLKKTSFKTLDPDDYSNIGRYNELVLNTLYL